MAQITVKVAEYRDRVAAVRQWLTSCKSAVGPKEQANEAAILRRSLAELLGSTCKRLTARDVESADAWIREAQEWLASHGFKAPAVAPECGPVAAE